MNLLDSDTPLPPHFGVGAQSLAASRALPEDQSGSRARLALRGWRSIAAARSAGRERGDPGAMTAGFPFPEVLPHYRTVGRLSVAPGLLADLRGVLGELESRPDPGDGTAPLLAWLRSATDQKDGNYESYLCAQLLARCAHATGRGADDACDELIAVLLADLARYEAEACGASAQLAPTDSRPQRARTVATARALSRLERIAPLAADARGSVAGMPASPSALPAARLADTVGRAAGVLVSSAAAPLGAVAEMSMLPCTVLHDEYMFIRSVQIFELLYWQIVRCLRRAVRNLLSGDHAGTCAQFADAADRLEATPALYRVLTTMPREAFATIRGATGGRSAIESRPYRMVEMMTAPRVLSADIKDKVAAVVISGPTVQEAFEARRDRMDAVALRTVTEAMRRLDTAWRAMKRTHWGITLKTIGELPGTGGTTGVRYLEAAARVPLFPLLHDADRQSLASVIEVNSYPV